jgi:anti-sigma B factor antagonist
MARPRRVKDAARHCPLIGVLAVSEQAWTTISVPAEIDIANAEEILAELLEALKYGCPILIVDMSRTSFCDCAGVRALLGAAFQALSEGGELRVVARARPVLRTFELTGLQQVVQVHPTTADAQRGRLVSTSVERDSAPRPRGSCLVSELTSIDLPGNEVSRDVLYFPVGVLREDAQPPERDVRRVSIVGHQDSLGLLDDGS